MRSSSARQANSERVITLLDEFLISTAIVWGIGLASAAASTPLYASVCKNFLSAFTFPKMAAKLESRNTAQVSVTLRPSGTLS